VQKAAKNSSAAVHGSGDALRRLGGRLRASAVTVNSRGGISHPRGSFELPTAHISVACWDSLQLHSVKKDGGSC